VPNGWCVSSTDLKGDGNGRGENVTLPVDYDYPIEFKAIRKDRLAVLWLTVGLDLRERSE